MNHVDAWVLWLALGSHLPLRQCSAQLIEAHHHRKLPDKGFCNNLQSLSPHEIFDRCVASAHRVCDAQELCDLVG